MKYPPSGGEPGRPVGIGRRMPALHLCYVLRRVKPIPLREFPIEPFRQALPDRGFTGARDADHYGNRRVVTVLEQCSAIPIFGGIIIDRRCSPVDPILMTIMGQLQPAPSAKDRRVCPQIA
jgi:hypothetical protein